jgi:hypothetical protein
VVIHVLVAVSKLVTAHVALGEKVICALGTAKVVVPNSIVELWKKMVAPVLGIPLAVKLALNQMKSPEGIGVPLKLEALELGVHGGGLGQLMLTGEKVIGIVLNPSNVAEPDGAKFPLKGPIDFVMGPLLKLDELAVKLIESLMVGPRPEIVQEIVHMLPGTSIVSQ